jgi:hypothetical protein
LNKPCCFLLPFDVNLEIKREMYNGHINQSLGDERSVADLILLPAEVNLASVVKNSQKR